MRDSIVRMGIDGDANALRSMFIISGGLGKEAMPIWECVGIHTEIRCCVCVSPRHRFGTWDLTECGFIQIYKFIMGAFWVIVLMTKTCRGMEN